MKTSTPVAPAPVIRHIYNPGFLSDDDLVAGFAARQKLFEFVRGDLARAPLQGNVQHYLLVGPRGAGKTTLLRRLAIAIRRDPDISHLLAVPFPEELYNVKGLSDLWWSACDSACEELELENRLSEASELNAAIDSQRPRGPLLDPHESSGLHLLLQSCAKLGRRPVLLIDNLDMVLRRIDKTGRKLKDNNSPAYWSLREVLSRTDAPIVIGGSVRLSEPFTGYERAFFDFFATKPLGKLSLKECRQVLRRMASGDHDKTVLARIDALPGRIRALHELTGGNPRALGLIYEVLRQGASTRAVQDFEQLIDLSTPYYKHRIEDLSEQAQVIMHAMAVRRPARVGTDRVHFGLTAAEIGDEAGLETKTVSAQLELLVSEGVVEKSSGKGRKQYRIAEQLFRLWLQMRGTRRVRAYAAGLAEFLSALYSYEELQELLAQLPADPLSRARGAYLHSELATSRQVRRVHQAEALDAARQDATITGIALDQTLPARDLDPDLAERQALREALERPRISREGEVLLPQPLRDRVLGSLTLGMDTVRQSMTRLDDAANRDTEMEHLEALMDAEDRRLAKDFDSEAIALLTRLRMRGCLPVSHLSPDDFQGLPPDLDMHDTVGMVIKLINAYPALVRLAPESAMAWIQWCETNAAQMDSGTWMLLGLRLIESGASEYSEAAYRHAIKLDATNAWPWINLGNVLQFHLNRFEEAETAYLQAIKLDKTQPVAWIALGFLLHAHLGRHSEAEVAYRRALEIDPADALTWMSLAFLLKFHMRRLDEANVCIRRAVDVDPTWLEQADVLLREWSTEGRLQQAHQALADNDWQKLTEILRGLAIRSEEEFSPAGTAMVEGLTAAAMRAGKGPELLTAMTEAGFERVAAPLLAALDAMVFGGPTKLAGAEPELRSAAKTLHDRLAAAISDENTVLGPMEANGWMLFMRQNGKRVDPEHNEDSR